ncbi:MAG TPA: hypothetical protein GXX37_12330 [Clostridiaceae bacterium]|nr:hypothetical protein [Clostridiaceae bacterium]
MNCEQVKDSISHYIDNELDEKECSEFEKHIKSCEACRNELNEILETVELLRSIPQVELPSNFKQELHEKLIKVKEEEEEKSRKKKGLLFFRNSYFKTISSVAAVVLIIFAIRGLFFGGFGFMTMTKGDRNNYSTGSTAPEVLVVEKASPRVGSSFTIEAEFSDKVSEDSTENIEESSTQDAQGVTDGAIVMFGTAAEPNESVGADVFTEESAEWDENETVKKKESSITDTILPGSTARDFMLSINPEAPNATDAGAQNSEEVNNTASTKARGILQGESFAEDTFLKNAKIRVKIMIYENAAKTDALEKVIRDYETSGDIVERSISDENKDVSIIEFNIKGSDYVNLANKIKSEINTSTLSIGSNLTVAFSNPVLVEDFKVKYDEYISQLNKINIRLSTLAEDRNNTGSPEKTKLIQDKNNIENNIKLLLDKYEYVANAEMHINIQEEAKNNGSK